MNEGHSNPVVVHGIRAFASLALLTFTSIVTAQPAPSTAKWFPKILKPDSQVYLPDFSYAGYRWGEQPLPTPQGKVFLVTDFGAKPDDQVDDTPAVLKALEAAHAHDGVALVRFPPGRFILNQILWLRRSHIVMQGAGSGAGGTTLFFPQPLRKMPEPDRIVKTREYLKRSGNGGYSPYSWTGGVIWTDDPDTSRPVLTKLTGGNRGGQQLTTAKAISLKRGEVVQVRWFNRGGAKSSFLQHLFDNQNMGAVGSHLYEKPDRPLITQDVTVESVEGTIVRIKEKLLHDIRAEWTPELAAISQLEEVGIEGLRIEFPKTPYRGHHVEAGFNGIHLSGLRHSWVRDVEVVHADSGLLTDNCKNVTIQNITVSGRAGHYTVELASSQYMLVRNFKFTAASLHNPSFNTWSKLNVYTNGDIREARFDQHNGVNHQNLFDNLRVTNRSSGNLFSHGGSALWRPAAGAFNTFWNIFVKVGSHPRAGLHDAPSARFVGFHGNVKLSLSYGPNAYIEGLNKPNLAVPSLYEYQLQQRLKRAR